MGEKNGMYYTIMMFAVIVYLFAIEDIGYISKILGMGMFHHLGKISYSIYMVHAIIVTGMYNVSVYLFHFQTGSVTGILKGVVFEYAVYLNIFFVIVVIWLSTLTYKYIEIPGQSYLKRRFAKHDK